MSPFTVQTASREMAISRISVGTPLKPVGKTAHFLYSRKQWEPSPAGTPYIAAETKLDRRPFRLQVNGPFQMAKEDGTPVVFPARTASAVLAFLSLSKGRPVQRRDLAQSLWPDHDLSAALTNLRTAIHRARKALGGIESVVADGDVLRLDVEYIDTDLLEAERLHRTFLLASNQSDGIAALAQEWDIRKRRLLEGWDFEWVEAFRGAAEVAATDVASDLAKHLEANGDPERASSVWRELLDRTPHHAEALQHAIRLEYQTHGKARALEVANLAVKSYRTDLGIEMPQSLQRIIREIRGGFYEPVPKPELIRTRNELLLLARMFESNLTSNRTEALAMLARECSSPMALAHPRTMLSLLVLALDQTEGTSPERIQVAVQATYLASWVSEFDLGHKWLDFLLKSLDSSDPEYAGALSRKGFIHFEQRQYDQAEKCLIKAIEISQAHGRVRDMYHSVARLAGTRWHRLRFEEALSTYISILGTVGKPVEPDDQRMLAMLHGNLCFTYTVMERWAEGVYHGRKCGEHTEFSPLYEMVYPAAMGLSLVALGERVEGLQFLSRAVSGTYREGMWRFNQISVDFAAVALAMAGRREAAECLLRANTDHRAILHHERSAAEFELIRSATGIDPSIPSPAHASNPLQGQSVGTLSQWVCEECERVIKAG